VDKPIASNVPAMMQRVVKELLPNAQEYAQLLSSTKIQNTINDNTQNLMVDNFSENDFVNNLNSTLDKEN
jgi:raffinose/stachyose/melibiose transport system substrate-binding protein